MTKAKKTTGTTPPVIQKLTVTQVNRGSQDIKNWKNALRSAESVNNPRRTLLYDLYEEILLDGHLTAVCEKRKGAIKSSVRVKFVILLSVNQLVSLINYY